MATVTWNTTGGDWFTATNWNEPDPLAPSSTIHVVPGPGDDVTFGDTGPYTVTYNGIDSVNSIGAGENVTLAIGGGSLTVGAGGGDLGTLSTVTGSSFTFGGLFRIQTAIINAGTIALNATTAETRLIIGLPTTSSPVSLTGGGKITMSDSANNTILIDNSSSLDNVDNTISGAGLITANFTSLTNEANGVIDATGILNSLTLSVPMVTNKGLLEATGTAGLVLDGATHGNGMTIENVGGTIAAIGAGTHVDLSDGPTIVGGTLTASGGGVIQVVNHTSTLDGSGTNAPVTITAGTTVRLNDGTGLNLAGPAPSEGVYINHGTIALNSTGDLTRLAVDTISLQGGGAVTLSDNANNDIFIGNNGSLDNVDNTISGAGAISANFTSMTNEAQGVIDATGTNALVLDLPTLVNKGLLEDTGTGGLLISDPNGITVANVGGTIQATAAGAHVDLNGATIQGGLLTGAFRLAGSNALDGTGDNAPVTIAAGSTLQLADNATLTLDGGSATAPGVIVNHGTITLNSTGDATRLAVTANGTVSLQGGGNVTLSDNAGNGIFNIQGALLDNVDNTISGAGGFGGLTNEAAGVVDATGTANALVASFTSITNKGLLEDTGTGGMVLSNDSIVNVGGTISATATGAHVDVDSSTITGGSLSGMFRLTGADTLDGTGVNAPVMIAAGSTLQLADNATLTLDGGSATNPGVIVNHGTITLNSTGDATRLAVTANGTVSLQGGGNVTLSDNAGNGIFDIQGALLDNVDNTISGAGGFGGLTNEAAGVVDATGTANALVASFTSITNKGLLEDTGTGGMVLSNDTVGNGGGTISASGTGAHVDLDSSTITGGTLTTAAGGVINVADTVDFDGATAGAVTVSGAVAGTGTLALTAGETTFASGATLATARLSVASGTTADVAESLTYAGALGNNGTVQLDGANMLELAGTVSGSGKVTFAPTAAATLQLDETALPDGQLFANTIGGFAAGDTIDLRGLTFAGNMTPTYDASTGTLTITEAGLTDTLILSAPGSTSFVAQRDAQGGTLITMPCYVTGTRIRTTRGDVAVEDLRIGDLVVTASGAERPIKWIGHRAYAGRFAKLNPDVLPICFKAGSLADNVPVRDLWVSPKHAIFFDGALFPAELLVNGVSVIKAERVDSVTYWHVELDSHDVLMAEGAAAESFVDDDGRGMFHNAQTFAAMYPDEATPAVTIYCAPRHEDGLALEAVRATLAARAGIGADAPKWQSAS